MPKKNRPSVLKRLREADKRQRQMKKAAKAAEKRERRLNKKDDEDSLEIAPEGEPAAPSSDLPAEPTDH